MFFGFGFATMKLNVYFYSENNLDFNTYISVFGNRLEIKEAKKITDSLVRQGGESPSTGVVFFEGRLYDKLKKLENICCVEFKEAEEILKDSGKYKILKPRLSLP